MKSLIKFETCSFFTPSSRTKNLLWKMGRGLGLCYHARSSYQEAQVGSDSKMLTTSCSLSLCLWLVHGAWLDGSRDLGLSERGFGFVTFKDPTAVQSVVTQGPHILDNKTVRFTWDDNRCWVFVYCHFCFVQIDPKPATQKSATQPVSYIPTYLCVECCDTNVPINVIPHNRFLMPLIS